MIRRLPSVLNPFDTTPATNRRQLQTAQRFLAHAVKTELTDRQKTILLLYYKDNLTMQQIADLLSLTRGTVCKHLHKAIDRLQRAARYAGFNDPQLRS